MCGIAGWFRPGGEEHDRLARVGETMAATLAHRGPDDSGTWIDPVAGVVLGFRRLAVIDLSPHGRQPMRSSDGRFVIVFNGEIYNFRDLRQELEARGRRFTSTSDTEVILEAVSEWGAEAAVPRLWGMFAMAIWDRGERRLLLARDRLGKKPLYFAETTTGLLFASELKALRAHPECPSEIDRDAVASFVRVGYVPAPRAIYAGVRKLRPGHLGVTDAGGRLAARSYWSAEAFAGQAVSRVQDVSADEAATELDRLLADAAARRLVADVPLGALLSGGIDSSLVVATMQAQSSRPVRTFTIGFEEREYDESEAARAVAAHLGTEHTELLVTAAEARDVIPRLADIYDEPFADSSQIPTCLVSELARRTVTVCLSGDGGDEIFGGYVRYPWASRVWRRMAPWPPALRRVAGRSLEAMSGAMADGAFRVARPILPAALRHRHPAEKLQKLAGLADAASDNDVYLRLVSQWQDPERLVPGHAGGTPFDAARNGILGSLPFVERMMLVDQLTYLPDDILVKVDRASMSVGLEVRAPLLDHRLLEWSWQLPRSLKVGTGHGKILLRRVLARYVPSQLTDRPKTGFGVSIGDWLRGPLRDWAEHLLEPSRLERDGLLDARPIRRVWVEHLSGRQNHQSRLWVVLMLQAWRERWTS